MAKVSKRLKTLRASVEANKLYAIDEAIALVKGAATAKFDESVDVSFNLGVDPRKSDQVVRGATVLPEEDPEGLAIGGRVELVGPVTLAPDIGWLGRIVDPLGRPLDGRPLLPGTREIDLPQGSLFSILGLSPLSGLSIGNVRYPLTDFALPFGSSRTISNVAEGPIRLSLASGRAILIARPYDLSGA